MNIVEIIDSYHESIKTPPRPHLGCSILGHPCDRYIWLSFRWALKDNTPGRVLRLFRRGQNEESTIISDLRAIGLEVIHTGKNQLNIDLGCHVSGSVDAVIDGLFDDKKRITEFKTHSRKSFDDLEKSGLLKSKKVHYIQMQLYMLGSNIHRGIYIAVCKDDDRFYTETVDFDEFTAIKYRDRGHRLALENNLPPPKSTDPSWYECKMCSYHKFCHVTHLLENVNCRTCAHSEPLSNSQWHCHNYDSNIDLQYQYTGCDDHIIHHDLTPWEYSDLGVFIIDGATVKNDANNFKSLELVAAPSICAELSSNPDHALNSLRKSLGARIVEIKPHAT